MSEDKKNQMIEEARTQYPSIKQNFEQRIAELKEAKYQNILKKQTRRNAEDKQSVKKINVCNVLVDNNINACNVLVDNNINACNVLVDNNINACNVLVDNNINACNV